MKKYLAIPAVALLFACSDGGSELVGNESSNNSAPSTTTLTQNYTATLTDAQIKADFEAIESTISVGAVLEASQNTPDIMGGMGGMGGLSKIAAQTCQSLDMDTTFIVPETGDTITSSTKATKGGKPFEFCMDPESIDLENMGQVMIDMMSAYNGVTMLNKETIKGKNYATNAEMSFMMNIDMEKGAMDFDVNGFSTFKSYDPASSMYATFDFMMKTTMSETETAEPVIEGSIVLHFNEGRYKCEMDMSKLMSETETVTESSKICDLTHNGEIVGELTQDAEGNAVITEK